MKTKKQGVVTRRFSAVIVLISILMIVQAVFLEPAFCYADWMNALSETLGTEKPKTRIPPFQVKPRAITLYTEDGKQSGKFLDGVTSGFGIVHLSNGCTHIGYFQNGNIEGYGVGFMPSDSEIELKIGEFKDAKMDGFGILLFKDGGIYLAEYENNKIVGNDTYVKNAEDAKFINTYYEYNGSMVDTVIEVFDKYSVVSVGKYGEKGLDGLGVKTERGTILGSVFRDVYVGEYKENKRNGWGFRIFDTLGETSSYEKGIWRNGKFQYESKEPVTIDGINISTAYVDLWEDSGSSIFDSEDYSYASIGQKESKSYWRTVCSSVGPTYAGNWQYGKYDGPGTMCYENGNTYAGNWHFGDREGKGTMYYANGDVYVGNWDNGWKEGKGTMYYANGDVYVGNWYLDNKEQGIMRYANMDVYTGKWSYDNKSGQGTMHYANGDVYEGYWYLDNKEGQGIMHYANGDVYEGYWSKGNPK